METLAQIIFNGGIGLLSAASEDYYGGALSSHLGRLIRERYGHLGQQQQAALRSLAFDSINAARAYLNGGGNYTPRVGDLPDPRRILQYAANQGTIDLTGARREVVYTFEYYTRVTDRATGAVEFRENRLVIRSTDPLSRDEAFAQAEGALSGLRMYGAGTDPRLKYEFEFLAIRGVNLSLGRP